MNEALSYIYYFYDKFINFVFNQMEFFSNVTFGWVLIVCFVFAILFRNILNLPVNGRIGYKEDDAGKYLDVKH